MSEDYFLNLQPGTIVNGRYEVVKCLGTGSMGLVYACRHRELGGHLVAMKVLFAEVARDDVAAARFRNEIVASYGVNHPNVVRAYEYFRDGDLIAFTMEYVGGGDLADMIGLDEPIPIPQIILMLKQMCGGVQAIHDAGIIHRDLKPENILLTENGDIKITDFGIARTGTGPKLTEHGGVVGTIDYVSPEYLEKGQVDFRSDIYALGILGYEMITGESPFKGQSVIETMTMRLKTDPTPPHELRSDCPKMLSEIIMRAMRRDPEDRYQKAQQMYDSLVAIGLDDQVTRGDFLTVSNDQESDGQRPSEKRASHGTISVGSGIFKTLDQQEDKFDKAPIKKNKLSEPANFDDHGDSADLSRQEEENIYLGRRQETLAQPKKSVSVSVSESHLSSQRIKELSSEFDYEDREGGGWATAILSILVVLAGLAVGLALISKIWPDLLVNNPLFKGLFEIVGQIQI